MTCREIADEFIVSVPWIDVTREQSRQLVALLERYPWESLIIELWPAVWWTDGSANEKAVARTWCRSGVPDWLKQETLKHAYEDGAITRFQGGVVELRAAIAAGGFLHTSGTRTSGGSKPCSIGSVGPHMQSAIGCDDSDEFRR